MYGKTLPEMAADCKAYMKSKATWNAKAAKVLQEEMDQKAGKIPMKDAIVKVPSQKNLAWSFNLKVSDSSSGD